MPFTSAVYWYLQVGSRTVKEVIAQAQKLHKNIATGRTNALAMQAAAAEKFHAKGGGVKAAAAASSSDIAVSTSDPQGERTIPTTPSNGAEKPSAAALLGAAAAAGNRAVAEGRQWGDEEQRALEQGLKQFPSSLKDERWGKIAGKLSRIMHAVVQSVCSDVHYTALWSFTPCRKGSFAALWCYLLSRTPASGGLSDAHTERVQKAFQASGQDDQGEAGGGGSGIGCYALTVEPWLTSQRPLETIVSPDTYCIQ
jgi:hypothetical protein